MDQVIQNALRERANRMYKDCDDITVLEDCMRFADSIGGPPPETIEEMKVRNLLAPGDLFSDVAERLRKLKCERDNLPFVAKKKPITVDSILQKAYGDEVKEDHDGNL